MATSTNTIAETISPVFIGWLPAGHIVAKLVICCQECCQRRKSVKNCCENLQLT